MNRGRPENEAPTDWARLRRLVLDEMGDGQAAQAEAMGVAQGNISTWRNSTTPPRSRLEQLLLCTLASMSAMDRRAVLAEGLTSYKRMQG